MRKALCSITSALAIFWWIIASIWSWLTSSIWPSWVNPSTLKAILTPTFCRSACCKGKHQHSWMISSPFFTWSYICYVTNNTYKCTHFSSTRNNGSCIVKIIQFLTCPPSWSIIWLFLDLSERSSRKNCRIRSIRPRSSSTIQFKRWPYTSRNKILKKCLIIIK